MPRKLTFSRWLNPRSVAHISVMTVSSVWNLIKDSSYLYWHSLAASDWSRPSPAGLSLAALWHLCPHCVTPGGAILNKIMTGLDWSQETFYLQFHSHCLQGPGPGGHQGTSRSLMQSSGKTLWWCLVSGDVSHVCWLLISVPLVTFGSHKSQMSPVQLTPRFRRKVQC